MGSPKADRLEAEAASSVGLTLRARGRGGGLPWSEFLSSRAETRAICAWRGEMSEAEIREGETPARPRDASACDPCADAISYHRTPSQGCRRCAHSEPS